VLPARRQARGLWPAERAQAALQKPCLELDLLGHRRGDHRAPRAALAAHEEEGSCTRGRRPMSDRLVTAPAHWGCLIVFYFFLGGIAAGSSLIAALLALLGRPEDRPPARLGYLVSSPALALCPPLLVLDLDQPARFWHLFWMSQRPGVMFKWWSPMSI